jgi:hypothetical protein
MKNKQLIIVGLVIIFLAFSCKRINGDTTVATMKEFKIAQEKHLSKFGEYGNVSQILAETDFERPINSESYYGYKYDVTNTKTTYSIKAIPSTAEIDTSYFMNEDGKIRFGNDPKNVNENSPEISGDSH